MLSWHPRRLWGCGLCVYALVLDQQSRGQERRRFLCTANKQHDCQCGFAQNLLWSVHYGPGHFSTIHTHRNTHTHARPQPFPWQEVEATYGRKRHYTALLPFEVRRVLFRCLWQCVCTRAPQYRLQTEQTELLKKREKYECYKTILFSMDADHINMLLSSISSVWEFCLTAHPTFSQPLKDPRVPFRRTTWRSPFTVRESSSSPAWWALWWCAGWETQPRNLISGASRLSTNWANRSLCGAR